MKKKEYKCKSCEGTFSSEEWNAATRHFNISEFEKKDNIDILEIQDIRDSEKGSDTTCFVCPNCDTHQMYGEIEEKERFVFAKPKIQGNLSAKHRTMSDTEKEYESINGIYVVFLDIEGVLRPDKSIEMFVESFRSFINETNDDEHILVNHYIRYAPWSVDTLNGILDIDNVYLVISSSLKKNMYKILDNFILNGIDAKKIIGRTPDFDTPDKKEKRGRGNEIKEFLNLYGEFIADYIVIDDDDFDLDPIPEENRIIVDTKFGLMRKHLRDVSKRWKQL